MKVSIEKITEVLMEELKFHVAMSDAEITLESKLEEDLDLDSLEVIELFLSLEDKYKGLEIDNRFMDIKKIITVEQLRDFIFENVTFPEDFTGEVPKTEK
jgi:acyl carrier protein|tara:strand:+ start:255 stop:554 length:300 start_codon:yes stop_codon:yes gene_type:complete